MDTTEKPKRKWYRKKRWWAALLLWLLLAYPLGGGPAVYAVCRGWLSWSDIRTVWPISPGGYTTVAWYDAYLKWWADRAIETNFRRAKSD